MIRQMCQWQSNAGEEWGVIHGRLEGKNMLVDRSLLICIYLHSAFISHRLLRTTLWFTILGGAAVQYGYYVKNNVFARLIWYCLRAVTVCTHTIWCLSSTTTKPVHAVTEIRSLRGAIIMRSGSNNNKINIEVDNDYDDDDDEDDDNLSAHTFVHIYNNNYFQCHKVVRYIVVDLRMEKLINCVLNFVCYSSVWFLLSSHLTYYIRERHYIIFC
jgi:hypothetical protein